MGWYEIRLELARTPKFTEGSSTRGYQIRAPLRQDWHLDEGEWRSHKKAATVHRFWEDEEDMYGNLIHTRHRTWAFSYEPGEDDDTPIFHLETHHFEPEEYITITEQSGDELPFKVIEVRPLIGYP